MISVRKLKLVILNNDEELRKAQYKFIRDSIYAQYRGLNRCMAYLMTGYYENNMDIKSDSFKEFQKTIKNTLKVFDGIQFGQGIDSKSMIVQKVKKDFSIALRNGLAKGERSVNNYKRNFPLMTRGRNLKFSYKDNGSDVIIDWVNGIRFEVLLGERKENTVELQYTLHKLINNEYKVSQSSIYFDKNNNLILNLTYNLDFKKSNEPVKGRCLGVDIGVKVPAYVSVSDKPYIRSAIGTASELVKVRAQFRKRRRRLQEMLKNSKGGQGRKEKLKSLEKFKGKEKEFAKTYNHMISKRIVEFAIKYKCEAINIENLTREGFSNRLLGMWGYYQLKSMIIYKAERAGIKINIVNPAFTSQACSKCGHIEKKNRESQEKFICKKCGLEINADYNASINIAQRREFEDCIEVGC